MHTEIILQFSSNGTSNRAQDLHKLSVYCFDWKRGSTIAWLNQNDSVRITKSKYGNRPHLKCNFKTYFQTGNYNFCKPAWSVKWLNDRDLSIKQLLSVKMSSSKLWIAHYLVYWRSRNCLCLLQLHSHLNIYSSCIFWESFLLRTVSDSNILHGQTIRWNHGIAKISMYRYMCTHSVP